MAAGLTKLAIEAAISRTGKGSRVELVDDRERGLRLRIGERGAKWSLQSRTKLGQQIRVPLGTWPGMTIAEARRAAQDVKRELDAGTNPNAERRVAIREAERAAKMRRLLSEILEQYQIEKLATLRRGGDARRALDGKKGLLRPMLRREPASITKAEIAEAVRMHAKNSPIAANRALAYASAFFNWCVAEDILQNNPAAGVKKPAKEVSRDRCHSVSELAEIWHAAGSLGYPFGQIYRLLIVLPMRRDEIAGLPLSELDLDRNGKTSEAVWTLPSGRTKNGQAFRIPLSPLATSIIQAAMEDPLRPKTYLDEAGHEQPNPMVFSMTGVTPVSGFGRAKRRLDGAIEAARKQSALRTDREFHAMPHWTIHDTRTTFTTLACRSLKVPANVADRCLNHVATATTSKIARIYNQDDLFDERRDALSRWGEFIETNVVNRSSVQPEVIVPQI